MKIPKPHFLIVGSAKCGTTALDSILESHPDCCMGRPKEVCFFQDTMDFKPNPNYEKGWDWYRKAFSHYGGELLVGEATPSYSDRSRSPDTARRIADFNPDMKVIYMVRKPLDRQISAWKMQDYEKSAGYWPDRVETEWASKGFPYWLERQRESGQWDECRYAYQLEAYREFFPDENIHVSFLEDWRTDKIGEVNRVLTFLGLDPTKWDSSYREQANRGDDRLVEKSWFRQVRQSPVGQLFACVLGKGLKKYLRKSLGTTSAQSSEMDLEAPIVSEFISFTEDDWKSTEPFKTKGEALWASK